MNTEMRAMLKGLAQRKCWTDDEDFDPSAFSGGNFDDAYSGGCDDGETTLARVLLEKFGKETP